MQLDRLLAAARDTIAEVPHAWLATVAEDGGAHARAVRVFPGRPGDDAWARRFLCRRDSRKAAEMRRAPRVTLAFQHASGNVYVALVGQVALIDDRVEMRSLWKGDGDTFPPDFIDAIMIVARLEVGRIEIHARGVTAEPFGHGRTLVDRTADGWRVSD